MKNAFRCKYYVKLHKNRIYKILKIKILEAQSVILQMWIFKKTNNLKDKWAKDIQKIWLEKMDLLIIIV